MGLGLGDLFTAATAYRIFKFQRPKPADEVALFLFSLLSDSVARLTILSPELETLVKFEPLWANCIFHFTVHPAIFDPHPASTG